MPLDKGNIAVIADGAAPFAVTCQLFGEQVTIRLTACLEPDGVIVVLADIGNLDVAYDFAVIHHGKAARPAVVEHSCLGDASWAAHKRSGRFAAFVYFFVASVTEGIAVFGHELELFFEFFGGPEVVAVKKGYPFAFCLCKGAVAGDGSSAVLGVFEVMDTRVWILRSAQDDTIHNFVGVVGAGIVNDNQFPVRVGLSKYGFYRFFDKSCRIVAGHDYGDKTIHFYAKASAMSFLASCCPRSYCSRVILPLASR